MGQVLVAVKVIVVDALAESAELGMYVAFKVVSLGENVPEPLVVHNPVVDEPDTIPFKLSVRLFAQSEVSGPAITVGKSVKTIFMVSVSAIQPPLFVEVRIISRITPTVSAAIGV